MSWGNLIHTYKGQKLADAPKGKSFDKASQDQKPSGYTIKKEYSGAGRDGQSVKEIKVPYYDKVQPKAAPVQKAVAAPKPAPKPAEKRMEAGSFKVSPEIQQAKDRVNAYEGNKSSAWDQSQATVQSSFIKPSSSSSSNQYNFSADSFEAKESPEPAEKAHAAQDKVQSYISKYSQYKSSN